jgi:hypothetical protein
MHERKIPLFDGFIHRKHEMTLGSGQRMIHDALGGDLRRTAKSVVRLSPQYLLAYLIAYRDL